MTYIQPDFFIDTANLDDIKQIWDKLTRAGINADSLRGITTNPNALDKIRCHDLKTFETVVYNLTTFLTSIQANHASVHVQMPHSHMAVEDLHTWITYITSLGNGKIKLSLKVSPYVETLNILRARGLYTLINVNVTGVADAATAFRCLSHPIKYVSIIPGRMEEVGIDASIHLKILEQRNFRRGGDGEVITGSMRTIDGLRRAINHRTIPTIGTRVWDAMTPNQYSEFVNEWWNKHPVLIPEYLSDIPLIDDRNIKLTQQFFEQMDLLGAPLYRDFTHTLCN